MQEQDEIHGFQQQVFMKISIYIINMLNLQDYLPPTLEAQQESCEHSSMKSLFVMGQMKREL